MPNKGNTVNEKWVAPSEIEWLTFGKVGDASDGSAFVKTQKVPEAMQVDDTGTYVYIGWAIPGKATSSDDWRICRIDTSGNKLWADGDALYNNIWDNRASLSYS